MKTDDSGQQISNFPSPPSPVQEGKARSCLKALLFVAAIVLLVVAIGYYTLLQVRQKVRAASCSNDVIMLYFAMQSYAKEHDGLIPPISKTRGNIMLDPKGYYPEHLDNSCWAQCEYSPIRYDEEAWTSENGWEKKDLGFEAFNDDSFCYLPWEIRNEKEGLAFIEAYKTLDLEKRNEDLVVEIDGQSVTLPRVRLGTTLPRTPIIVEWPNHAHKSATVLYAGDGTWRSDLFEGFPFTEKFIEGLREIASMDGPIPEWEI